MFVKSNFSFSQSVLKRLVQQMRTDQGLFGKGLIKSITTQYGILMHQRHIAVENIVKKGEIVCNKQFLLFTQCFLTYMVLFSHFKCTLIGCLQFLSVWTSQGFCRLIKSLWCVFLPCSDHDEFFRNTKQVLDEIGVTNYTSEDCKIVKYICTLVSARAAFLSSSGLATLINRSAKPQMTIAVDGSLYRFHPRFHNLMVLKIQELIKPGLKVLLLFVCGPESSHKILKILSKHDIIDTISDLSKMKAFAETKQIRVQWLDLSLE